MSCNNNSVNNDNKLYRLFTLIKKSEKWCVILNWTDRKKRVENEKAIKWTENNERICLQW